MVLDVSCCISAVTHAYIAFSMLCKALDECLVYNFMNFRQVIRSGYFITAAVVFLLMAMCTHITLRKAKKLSTACESPRCRWKARKQVLRAFGTALQLI